MSVWMNRKVLVTGAGGFIGSHLCEKLVREGAKVRAFVRYNSRNDWGNLERLPKEFKSSLNIISGDLTDSGITENAVKGSEVVFHLGALIAIPYSYMAPRQFVDTNIYGTLNVLEACRKFHVERLIHTSTSEVYGTALYTPIDEKHPQQAQSPYSASKIGADRIAESYFRSFGLPVSIIRPFNTFGPRQSLRAVIPTIISQAMTGDVIKLGALDPIRDLTYVSDTVNGLLDVASSSRAIGEVVNIGNGKGISIGDLVKLILQIMGRQDVKILSEKSRYRPENSEVYELICDNRKARELCGWKPKLTLREGLEKTIDWVEKNLSRLKSDLYNV